MVKESFTKEVILELEFRFGWEGPEQRFQSMERQRDRRLSKTLRGAQITDKSYRTPS